MVAAVIFAYQPAWTAGFIWDDDDYVTHNPLLTAPDGLKRIWFSTDSPSQYFPLTYTSFRVQHALWGLNPAGYHWVNILLHAVNALLVWRLLCRLAVPGAWLGAAIFALHPVQVESVAWITELKNVQSLFFFLLALLAWIEFVEERRGWGAYALSLLCCALALFSKTTACTLPAALLLVLWLRKKPIDRARILQIVPFVAISLAMGLVTVWWERHEQGTDGSGFGLGPLERVLLAGRALWFYLGKFVWPTDLAFSYPRWTIDATNPAAYVWLAATAALGAVIFFVRRFTGRGVETTAVFYVAMLSPLLGFFMLYTFRYSYVADHYQYVALIGPGSLVGAVAGRAVANSQLRLLGLSLGAGLLVALGLMTWQQSQTYRDLETLWRATLARNPNSFIAHNNLSALLLAKGQADEALAHAETALQLQPTGPDYALARTNRGGALLHKGQADAAIPEFEEALKTQPDYADAANNLGSAWLQKGEDGPAIAAFRRALEIKPQHVNARYNLGNALLRTGQVQDAIASFEQALSAHPDDPDIHNDLGTALVTAGRTDEGIRHFETVVKLRPNFAPVHNNLGFLLLRKGRPRDALAHYETALKLEPSNARTLSSYAWALATCGDATVRDGAKALELAQRASELTGGEEPASLLSLAAALAETGRFGEAVATAERALHHAQAGANSGFARMIESHLASFRAGVPVRDTTP